MKSSLIAASPNHDIDHFSNYFPTEQQTSDQPLFSKRFTQTDSVNGRWYFREPTLSCQGKYGDIFLAVTTTNPNTLAMKKSNLSKHSERAKKLLCQEVDLVKEIGEHQNIVNFVAAEIQKKDAVIVMEYYPRGDLYKFIRRMDSFLAPILCCSIMLDIAAGLAFLHEKGIIHRHLNAKNILVDNNGRCRLTDFGFAKKLGFFSSTAKLQCGTLEYMAPEILLKEAYDKKVDAWALGILMCFAMTFEFPHDLTFESSVETIRSNLSNLSFTDPGFQQDATVTSLVTSLLQFNPKDRPNMEKFHGEAVKAYQKLRVK
jgi:serine/threonine protein kinase